MTRREYEYLQERLSKLIEKRLYAGEKRTAYERGVLGAKSVLKEVFDHQQKTEETTIVPAERSET